MQSTVCCLRAKDGLEQNQKADQSPGIAQPATEPGDQCPWGQLLPGATPACLPCKVALVACGQQRKYIAWFGPKWALSCLSRLCLTCGRAQILSVFTIHIVREPTLSVPPRRNRRQLASRSSPVCCLLDHRGAPPTERNPTAHILVGQTSLTRHGVLS